MSPFFFPSAKFSTIALTLLLSVFLKAPKCNGIRIFPETICVRQREVEALWSEDIEIKEKD